MPVSAWHYITPILNLVHELHTTRKIRSMLDIGCGTGKWGFLVRDVVDLYCGAAYFREDWQMNIEGVEIFERYRNPMHGYSYNTIHWGNALELIDTLGTYDLIFAMEVIEHIEKEQGKALLEKLVKHATRAVILSFPPEIDEQGHHVLEQKGSYGNEHEAHLSIWHESDLAGYNYRKVASQCYAIIKPLVAPTLVSAGDVQERDGGARVLVSEASFLEYEVPSAAAAVELDVLKHPWSSTLLVADAAGRPLLEENLFSEKTVVDRLYVPVDSATRRLRLAIRANPRSRGNEAWIHAIAVR